MVSHLFRGREGLYAAVDLTREYDDNVLRQNNQTIGDDRYILAPLVGYEGELGRHTYELSYSGSYVSYRSLNSENNRNHVFSGSAQLGLTKILKGEVRASYEMGVEPRGGTAWGLSQSTAPDAFRSSATGLTLTLGRRIAKAQIEAKFDHSATRYTNNAQQGRNLDTHRIRVERLLQLWAKAFGVCRSWPALSRLQRPRLDAGR